MNRTTRALSVLLGLAFWLGIATPDGYGELIIAPVAVLSEPTPNANFDFSNTINQVGLSQGYTSGVTDFNTYAASNPTFTNKGFGSYGVSLSHPVVDVIYDLGSAITIDKLAFWNYPFTNSAGVEGMQIFTSNVADFSSEALVGTFSPADDAHALQVFNLTTTTARYVDLHITETYTSNGTGFAKVAFGEVTPSAVPEPASSVLMLSGLGAVGLFLKARRRKLPLAVG